MKYNYININELIIEDLLSSNLLNVIETDSSNLIEDVICITLSNTTPRYIRHHIDFSYSKSLNPETFEHMESILASTFNSTIDKIRTQGTVKDWQ